MTPSADLSVDLSGKHALVTGGGTGVGAIIAQMLAGAGAFVTITGRRAEPLNIIAATSDRIFADPCDVTDPAALKDMISRTATDRGGLSIVIANAGAASSSPFAQMTQDHWQQTLAVNLGGVFNSYQAALPHMDTARYGRLIAIASTAGIKGYPYVTDYCAAKHGVIGLTRALALELAATQVTVNAICPGFTETPLLERSIDTIMTKTGMDQDAARRALMRSNPQARFIQPEEIAQSVLWLCANASASITGQAISISGGEI